MPSPPSLAHADPDPQPASKTLERAAKLYDRKDYISATVELEKVLDGESGDDASSVQRAQFFMAKTMSQLGFLHRRERVLRADRPQNPSHRYFKASMKWLVFIATINDIDDIPALRTYKLDVADDPSLDLARDNIRFVLGEVALRHADFPTAETAFAAVTAGSQFYARARFGLGVVAVRNGDDKAALAAFAAVAPNSDAGDLSRLAIVAVDVHARKWDDAIAAASKVGGALAPRAAWEVQVARTAKQTSLGRLEPVRARRPWVALDAPEPVLLQVVATWWTTAPTRSRRLARTVLPSPARSTRCSPPPTTTRISTTSTPGRCARAPTWRCSARRR